MNTHSPSPSLSLSLTPALVCAPFVRPLTRPLLSTRQANEFNFISIPSLSRTLTTGILTPCASLSLSLSDSLVCSHLRTRFCSTFRANVFTKLHENRSNCLFSLFCYVHFGKIATIDENFDIECRATKHSKDALFHSLSLSFIHLFWCFLIKTIVSLYTEKTDNESID
jgi:hypothetical protein